MERLTFHAFKTKGISVAALADSLDAVRGTLLVDQAEILSNKNYLELLGILADSYTPGGGRRRIVNITPKGRRLLEFETYSPKGFASILELDEDLRDRCILFPMVRAGREYPYPEPFRPVWAEMRDILYRLLLTRWRDVQMIYQTAGEQMSHRAKELWKPLDSVLTLEEASGAERDEVREAFLIGIAEMQSEFSDREELLFSALFILLDGFDQRVLTAHEIAETMTGDASLFKNDRAKTTWIGSTIKRLSLYEKKLPKDPNSKGRHPYRFTTARVKEIYERYQTGGEGGIVVQRQTQEDSTGIPPGSHIQLQVVYSEAQQPPLQTTIPPLSEPETEVVSNELNPDNDSYHHTTSASCLIEKKRFPESSFEEF